MRIFVIVHECVKMRNGPILGPEPIQIRVKIKKNRIGTIRYLGHMDKSGQKNLVYLGLGNIQKNHLQQS